MGFVEKSPQLLQDDTPFVLWPFLFRPVPDSVMPEIVWNLFAATAFYHEDDQPLPAYDVWLQLETVSDSDD